MINFEDTKKLINEVEGFLDDKHLRTRLFGKILQMQYFFYNTFLLDKYINKTVSAQDMCGKFIDETLIKKISNHYYETLYTYTNVALIDEVQEIKEKFNKINTKTPEEIDDLFEEFIDAFHFVTQHFVLQIEHNYFGQDITKYEFYNNDRIKYNPNYENILDLCKHKASHIVNEVIDNYPIETQNIKHITDHITEGLNKVIEKAIKLQEQFNWKIWKDYPVDFYSASKFSEIANKTYDVFYELFYAFSEFCYFIDILYKNDKNKPTLVTDLAKSITPEKYSNNMFNIILIIMFSSYYTKHKINIDRQCDTTLGYVNYTKEKSYFNIFEE